jgi:dTDP-glucose pyrophosphorylase
MNKKQISVIIPAAGKATRMRPLSNAVSKAMVPVNGKPIISYIINHLYKIAEPVEIIIVQNELGDIENFVSTAYPNLYNHGKIRFAYQPMAEGPLQAVALGNNKLERNQIAGKYADLPVLVWLGDTICLEQEFDFSRSFLVTSPVQDYQRWCLVDKNCNFYDKPDTPPRTDKALIGIYYFNNPKVYQKALDKGMHHPKYKGEYQIASLLNSYIDAGQFFDLEITREWYDCGELHTYYESKAKLLNRSARAFNRIEVDTFLGTVTKSANDAEKQKKIEMEKQWFLALPQKSSLFAPRVLNSQAGTLVMSQEPGTPLNEIWLYENLRYDIWTQIIDKVMKIHNEVFLKDQPTTPMPTIAEKNIAMQEMYVDKNLKRLLDYKSWPEFDTVYNFVKKTGKDLVKRGCVWTPFLHGDSHLGNILFEPMQGSLKFVDPRGNFGNIVGTVGDLRYDMAKFAQDFYMDYADILAGNYKIVEEPGIIPEVVLHRDTALSRKLSNYIKQKLSEYGYDWEQIFHLSIVLIITCIPFHYDDPQRQRAFWLHALERIKSIG